MNDAAAHMIPKPTQQAVDMLVKVGPICVPRIKRGLAAIKNRHKRVLEQALERLEAENRNHKPGSKRRRDRTS